FCISSRRRHTRVSRDWSADVCSSDLTEAIRMGRPVNVVHPVKGEDKQKPVNYDTMALPTNAKTIARKAQQAGIPPNVALTIAHKIGRASCRERGAPSAFSARLIEVRD